MHLCRRFQRLYVEKSLLFGLEHLPARFGYHCKFNCELDRAWAAMRLTSHQSGEPFRARSVFWLTQFSGERKAGQALSDSN